MKTYPRLRQVLDENFEHIAFIAVGIQAVGLLAVEFTAMLRISLSLHGENGYAGAAVVCLVALALCSGMIFVYGADEASPVWLRLDVSVVVWAVAPACRARHTFFVHHKWTFRFIMTLCKQR